MAGEEDPDEIIRRRLEPGGGEWAGHSSAAFTKSRYAHLFPEHGEALADRLKAFIDADPGGLGGVPPQILMCTRCAPAGSEGVGLTGLHPL